MNKIHNDEVAINKSAWEKIEQKRREKGVTLNELANAAKCTRQYLSKCKKDNKLPQLMFLCPISDKLDINIGWLFGAEASTFQHINSLLRELNSSEAIRIRNELDGIAEVLVQNAKR